MNNAMYDEERSNFIEMLYKIMDNPENVLVHESFFSNQWIKFNSEKDYYEYEDHAYLGEAPIDVVEFLESIKEDLVIASKWHIEKKNC